MKRAARASKGDLCELVGKAVLRRVFDRTVQQARQRLAELAQAAAATLPGEAAQGLRARMRAEAELKGFEPGKRCAVRPVPDTSVLAGAFLQARLPAATRR